MRRSFLGIILIIVLVLGSSISTAQAQDPRPTHTPGGSGSSGGGGVGPGGGGSGGASPDGKCASLLGQVINWGAGGEGGVTTQLQTGSWQVSTVSATDGNYGFGGLGVGVALLHVALTPQQAERYRPLIQDAGVYLNCDYPLVANIALFNGPSLTPPATIEMSARHRTLTAGGGTEITLKVKNTLPNDITNVVVTDLMPPGLIALDVSSAAAKNTDLVNGPDGQLVVINLDRLASGAAATIRITVMVAADLPRQERITNTATLFYRESAAHQAKFDFTISSGAVSVLAPTTEATPAVTPQVKPTPVAAVTATTPVSPTVQKEDGEAFVPPGGLPTTGEDFVPPEMLPVTGADTLIPKTLPKTGLGVILPLSGLILGGLAFLARQLRSSRRHRD